MLKAIFDALSTAVTLNALKIEWLANARIYKKLGAGLLESCDTPNILNRTELMRAVDFALTIHFPKTASGTSAKYQRGIVIGDGTTVD